MNNTGEKTGCDSQRIFSSFPERSEAQTQKPLHLMSFDIGIKNLSYCMISSNNNDVVISDWKVLDISKGESDIDVQEFKCSCLNKIKKINQSYKVCGKNAKYEMMGQFYCEVHAKLTNSFIIPSKENSNKTLKKLKKSELINLCIKYGIFNEDETAKSKPDIMMKLCDFLLTKRFVPVNVEKSVNASDINLISLGRNMKRLLDNVDNLEKVTHIILENQMSTIATRMKTIQGMLAQYFIMKLDKEVLISFVSSFNKLRLFPKSCNVQDNYKQHKEDAIYHTRKILDRNISMQSWLHIFVDPLKRPKKIDDLCDSFLQGIWYLNSIKYLSVDGYDVRRDRCQQT
jgi:hypothetical protein